MKDDNKQHFTDTVKDMADDPKKAIKKDYEQTKEDVKDVKEKMMGDE